MTQAILTFLGGLVAGFLLAYVKYVFDAEKSRFDFRTKILREVWEAVLYAKSLSVNLDPQLEGHSRPGESRDQKLERRLPEYYEAHLAAKRLVLFNSPFYPVQIHDLANEILVEADMNATIVKEMSPKNVSDYWKRIADYKKKLDAMANQLREDIRQEVNRPALNPFKWLRGQRLRKPPEST